jgi:PAS domain S-box-containing protein
VLLVTSTPRLGEAGVVVGSSVVFRDITEWERTEHALRESERRYRDLFDSAPVGYHEIDAEGRITRVNRTELQLLGYTEEEMLGRFAYEFVADRDQSAAAMKAKLEGRKDVGVPFERVLLRKDGGFVPVLMEDRYLLDALGRIVGIRTTLQNITERKRTEEELRQNVERLKRALKAVHVNPGMAG